MPELALTTPLPDLPQDEPILFRLSDTQHAQMYDWLEQGKLTHAEIAERLGCSRPNITQYAKRFGLSPKLRLRSRGADITEAWLASIPVAAAKGDSRPMERALLYGGHLEPLSNEANKAVVVQIGVALSVGEAASDSTSACPASHQVVLCVPEQPGVQAKAVPAEDEAD